MKYIYLVNRFNFKEKTEELVEKLNSVSQEMNRDYEIIVNDTVEDAKTVCERFRDTEYVITAIGGDGSINLVLNDLIGTRNILAYIPTGTGNDLYRATMEDLDDGVHKVDIARINDRYFINVACFGIDADIANDDNFIHNKLIPASMRYNAGVIYHFLTYKDRKMKIECDNETFEQDFTTVVVANARYYGGGYNVSPFGKIDDGILDIYMVDRLNKPKMASIILSMKNADHLNNPALRILHSDRIVISSDQPFKANIDGEPLLADRFEIEVVPKGFRIDIDKEFLRKMKN